MGMKISPNFNIKFHHNQPQNKNDCQTNSIEPQKKLTAASKCTASFGMAQVNMQNSHLLLDELRMFIKICNSGKKAFDKISEYATEMLVKNFDVKNFDRHLKNLKFLNDKNQINYLASYAENGYFASEKGAKYFEKAAEHFNIREGVYYGEKRCDFDLVLDFLSPKLMEKADKRGLFESSSLNADLFMDLAKLTDKEWNLVDKNGFLQKGLGYASENPYINNFFAKISEKLEPDSFLRRTHGLKNLEQTLINSSKNNNDELARTAKALDSIKDFKNFDDFYFSFNPIQNLDLKLYLRNIERIKTLLTNKLPNYDPSSYKSYFDEIMTSINKHNLKLVDKLVNVERMTPRVMLNTLKYSATRNRTKNVENIIEKINRGEEKLIALPSAKNAKLNPILQKAREYKYPIFTEGTDLKEVASKTKQGEISAIGKKAYINDKNEMQELGLDFETFEKLFPPYETLCMKQSDNAHDCYVISGGILTFMRNPKARVKLMQMFSKDGNDVIVTIPALKDYPIRFLNGEAQYGSMNLEGSKGIIMLEEAYAKARYIKENNLNIPSELVNADDALEHISRGLNHEVYNDFFGTKDSKAYLEKSYKPFIKTFEKQGILTSKDEMKKLLDKFAQNDNILVSAATGRDSTANASDYSIMMGHAYAIEKIDKKNKAVYIINPYNTMYNVKVPYDIFVENFNCLFVRTLT